MVKCHIRFCHQTIQGTYELLLVAVKAISLFCIVLFQYTFLDILCYALCSHLLLNYVQLFHMTLLLLLYLTYSIIRPFSAISVVCSLLHV